MRTMQFTFGVLEQSHEDMLLLCEGADLVITSHSAAGTIEADKLGLPTVSVCLKTLAIPKPDPHASLFSRVIMGATGAGMGMLMTRPLNHLRHRLGVPPMGKTGITSPLLNLIATSPLVDPPYPSGKRAIALPATGSPMSRKAGHPNPAWSDFSNRVNSRLLSAWVR